MGTGELADSSTGAIAGGASATRALATAGRGAGSSIQASSIGASGMPGVAVVPEAGGAGSGRNTGAAAAGGCSSGRYGAPSRWPSHSARKTP